MRMDPTPRELVVRARQRDPKAFAALISFHERSALAIAYAILRDASSAGDAVQEAFIKAWNRLPELKEPERFAAWLAQIVRHAALDDRRRRPTVMASAVSVHDADPEAAPCDPGSGIDQSEERTRIDAALADLDEVTRTVVVLRYYEDLSSKTIADTLGLTPAAVDMRLSRARRELKQKLCQGEVP